ncbi:MAG: hypothetical protein HYZ20_15360 [Burkholderiales bacterium]|nr:hypothetical protein [Burkholderiales bacterium]
MQGPVAEIRRGRVELVPGQPVAPDALAAAIRADAARMLARDDGGAGLAVTLQDAVWSDGSLGCPQPGMMYTQALVPGWRVVVGDGAREWVYHASRAGAWLHCPAGIAQPPLTRDVLR